MRLKTKLWVDLANNVCSHISILSVELIIFSFLNVSTEIRMGELMIIQIKNMIMHLVYDLFALKLYNFSFKNTDNRSKTIRMFNMLPKKYKVIDK